MSHKDQQFKDEAIRLALTSTQSIAQTARDLGIKENTLYNWVNKAKSKVNSESGRNTTEPNLLEELNRLRKENARLKEIPALRMALLRRNITSGLLLHSDRGSQYASANYQQLLHENNIQCSISRKGDCWDNSAMESFFHSLKTECTHHEKYQTRGEAKRSVFDYIEVFYNRQRRHSSLGYLSPTQYEMQAC